VGKLKEFFANTHVITTIALICVFAVIWIVLYLMIKYPIEFTGFSIVTILLIIAGYFTIQTYRVILGLVEQYKEDRR
jgi:hypothetical protein